MHTVSFSSSRRTWSKSCSFHCRRGLILARETSKSFFFFEVCRQILLLFGETLSSLFKKRSQSCAPGHAFDAPRACVKLFSITVALLCCSLKNVTTDASVCASLSSRFVRCRLNPESPVASRMRIQRVPALACYKVTELRSLLLRLSLLPWLSFLLLLSRVVVMVVVVLVNHCSFLYRVWCRLHVHLPLIVSIRGYCFESDVLCQSMIVPHMYACGLVLARPASDHSFRHVSSVSRG